MSEGVAGKALYEFGGDLTELRKTLAEARKEIAAEGQKAEGDAKAGMGRLGALAGPAKLALVGVGTAVGAIGGVAMQMGQEYAGAMNTMIQRTGASGAALDALMGSVRNVAGRVPEDMTKVADVVGLISQKLHLEGADLEEATQHSLDFARINKVDVTQSVTDAAAALDKMNLPATELPGLLDKITFAAQQTGTNAGALTANLATVGPTLQSMGYSLDGSIALLAQWTQMGGDATQLSKGLNKAMVQFAKEGATDAQSAMQDLVQSIKDAPNQMAAAGIAAGIFGGRVGNNMATMVRNGTLDVEALTKAVHDQSDTVETTTERTKTWEDKFKEFFNGLAAQIGPVTGQIGELGVGFEGFARILGPVGGALGGIATLFATSFKGLAAKIMPEVIASGTEIGTAHAQSETAAATGEEAISEHVAAMAEETPILASAAAGQGAEMGAAEASAQTVAYAEGEGAMVAAAESVGTKSGAAGATAFIAALGPIALLALVAKFGTDFLSNMHLPGNLYFNNGKTSNVDAAAKEGAAQADALKEGYEQRIAENGALGPALPTDFVPNGVAETAGRTAASDMLATLADYNIPDEWAKMLGAQAVDTDKTGGFAKFTDPAVQAAFEAGRQIVSLVGVGVPADIATAWATGGKPMTDAMYAMLNGLTFDPSVNGPLAALYEQLNVPQNLAVAWSTTGAFDLQKALAYVMADAMHSVPAGLASSTLTTAFGGEYAQTLIDAWTPPVTAAAKTTGTTAGDTAGKSADSALAKALVANAGQVKQAADKVHQDLLDALQGKPDATTAVGKKTIKWFDEGIVSGIPGTVLDSQQLGLNSLAALGEAIDNGKGTTKGAKDIGIYLSGLVASGISSQDILVKLSAAGVGAKGLAAIQALYPQFFSTGQTSAEKESAGFVTGANAASPKAVDAVRTGVLNKLKAMPWESGGANAGDSWTAGFTTGVDGAKAKLAGVLNKLAHMTIGNSPPPEGPLKHIDKGGFNIGRSWGLAIVDGANSVDYAAGMNRRLGSEGIASSLNRMASSAVTVQHELTLTVRDPDGGLRRAGIDGPQLAATITPSVADVIRAARDSVRIPSLAPSSV